MTRKEAREYIIKHCNPHRDTSTQWDDAMECAIKALEEPERKTGEWVFNFKDKWKTWYECSECGREFTFAGRYCPHCGAEMRKKNEI